MDRIVGQVRMRRVARGSRHEHDAVILETGEGRELVLRTEGKSAFQHDEFDPFIDRRVAVVGRVVEDRLIFAHDVTPVGPDEPGAGGSES